MAKRGAEALACRAPRCESFAAPEAAPPPPPPPPLKRRCRGDAPGKGEPKRSGAGVLGLKRKRAGGGQEEAAEAKRPSGGPSREPPQEQEGHPKTPPEENEDDVWRYNSFQYWRSPLPAIDLSDILDLEKADTGGARWPSSVCLSEMET